MYLPNHKERPEDKGDQQESEPLTLDEHRFPIDLVPVGHVPIRVVLQAG